MRQQTKTKTKLRREDIISTTDNGATVVVHFPEKGIDLKFDAVDYWTLKEKYRNAIIYKDNPNDNGHKIYIYRCHKYYTIAKLLYNFDNTNTYLLHLNLNKYDFRRNNCVIVDSLTKAVYTTYINQSYNINIARINKNAGDITYHIIIRSNTDRSGLIYTNKNYNTIVDKFNKLKAEPFGDCPSQHHP